MAALNCIQASPDSLPLKVLPVLGLIIVLRVLWIAVYRLVFHPLAKYPGPILAKLSGWYTVSQAVLSRDTYTRYALHKKYGPVVRMGPNELCFADTASIKDIYGQSAEPCLKQPAFYSGFTLTGKNSVFSSTKRDVHARMRRLMSHGLSERAILQFQDDMKYRIGKYLSLIVSPGNKAVEIYTLTQNLYLDIVSELAFAESFDILSGGEHQGARDIETYFEICPLFGTFPLARYLPFGVFKAARQARPRILQYVQSCIDNFRHRLREGTSQTGLLRLMVEAEDKETRASFSDDELIENAVIVIIAGSGTTATAQLSMIYELGKHPEMQRKLESEIRHAFPDQTVFPDYEVATELPYLNCVLQETMRLRGPIPTFSPRISPGKVIGGEYIPAGTLVSNLAYTTHRDPRVFPHPTEFIPERWENPTKEMKLMYRPFSTGPRNCVGMHLARVQLLLAVCALYQRFDITLDPSTTEELMIMRDQVVMSPSGKKLWINAKPRK
ncbi:cytochrome P450 [Paraphoma chrysanthemicola]|uniref:Cytochrome P450 n=1 Tax=Paraphoma chrysanthemicola TaxID=798071 RepID=A0A8K0QV33_9PLEO|nr:cytochrome P450 [Paraphoma chrysanthemicola]